MLLKSLILRPEGSVIDLEGRKYHFKPLQDGGGNFLIDDNGEVMHVCEVQHPAHIARLLSIPEGFTTADPQQGLPATIVSMIRPVENNVRPVKTHEFSAEAKLDEMEEREPDFVTRLSDLDIPKMTSRQLREYCLKVIPGINPASREAICNYAQQQFDVKLNHRLQPMVLLKQLFTHMKRAEKEDGMDGPVTAEDLDETDE